MLRIASISVLGLAAVSSASANIILNSVAISAGLSASTGLNPDTQGRSYVTSGSYAIGSAFMDKATSHASTNFRASVQQAAAGIDAYVESKSFSEAGKSGYAAAYNFSFVIVNFTLTETSKVFYRTSNVSRTFSNLPDDVSGTFYVAGGGQIEGIKANGYGSPHTGMTTLAAGSYDILFDVETYTLVAANPTSVTRNVYASLKSSVTISTAPVPEPSSIAAVGFGITALLRRRRRP